MIFYIVDEANQVIENVIVWDGESEYDPGTGKVLVEGSSDPGAPAVGWKRGSDGSFEPPSGSLFALVRRSDGVVGAVQQTLTEAVPEIPVVLDDPHGTRYFWEPCNEEVQSGWLFSNGAFSPPA